MRRLPVILILMFGGWLARADDPIDCGRDVRVKLLQVLYQAVAIDPETGKEDRAGRQAQRREQQRLDDWFTAKGRNVSSRNCTTPEDQANLLRLPLVLANQELLRKSPVERRRFIAQVTDYLERFEKQLAPSLMRFAPGDELQEYLRGRLQLPLTFQPRYFGRTGGRTVLAMYIPMTRLTYLNIDGMSETPETFYDSFEHEFWHHLLPPPLTQLSRNLWFEGFNECLAEGWAEELYADVKAQRRPRAGIEYPVATAWASLYVGSAKVETLEFLAGLRPAADYCRTLQQHGTLGEFLADHFENQAVMPPAEQAQIEGLLRGWGWKEDDGSPLTLSRYLAAGRLRDRLLYQELLQHKDFLEDLIQAKTIVHLQALAATFPIADLPAQLRLPPHLVTNLKDVLKYVRNPQEEYRQ